MKNIFWVVGDESGDLHVAHILAELNKQKKLHHFGIGGSLMQKENFESIYPFDKFTVMGFFEVIQHLPFFLKVEKKIEEIFIQNPPDLVILVDYPGLNLRVAKIAKRLGLKVIYYISPQFWAWKYKRIDKLKRLTDHVIAILPFEKDIFDKENVKSTYVGHPIAEEIRCKLTKAEFAQKYKLDFNKKWIGFLPGSRKTEIKKMLPLYLDAIQYFNSEDFEFIVSHKQIQSDFQKIENITYIKSDTYELMKHSKLLAVTSGTATLETAYLGTPFIIVYKTSKISYLIGKKFIKIDKIGLPNIILDKIVIPELIQEKANGKNIAANLKKFLENESYQNEVSEQLQKIHKILGKKSASKETARIILEYI